MTIQPATTVTAHVRTPTGLVVKVPEGSRLIFGRGSDADLTIAVGRGLSRRAGVISVLSDGAWIANISRTHALYTEGDGYRIRLPRMEEDGEPVGGWFLRTGTTLVGSRAMLDEGQPVAVTISGQHQLGRGGRRRQPGPPGHRDHAAAAVPGPDDQDLPGRPDVVPPVAAGPGRDHPAAADAGDRPRGAGGDRRLPRAGALRHRLGVP